MEAIFKFRTVVGESRLHNRVITEIQANDIDSAYAPETSFSFVFSHKQLAAAISWASESTACINEPSSASMWNLSASNRDRFAEWKRLYGGFKAADGHVKTDKHE